MTLDENILYTTSKPWVILMPWSDEDNKWNQHYLYNRSSEKVLVRKLRGKKMKTKQSLMNEIGAALQFFEGFGENWHALNECLCYLDEWMKSDCYIFVVTQAEFLLIDEPKELKWFMKTLEEVAEWWSTPIVDNDRYNRVATPFHVVFKYNQGSFEEIKRHFLINADFDIKGA